MTKLLKQVAASGLLSIILSSLVHAGRLDQAKQEAAREAERILQNGAATVIQQAYRKHQTKRETLPSVARARALTTAGPSVTQDQGTETDPVEYVVKNLCLYCNENEVDTALYPCGHASACQECVPHLILSGKCPICRLPLDNDHPSIAITLAGTQDVAVQLLQKEQPLISSQSLGQSLGNTTLVAASAGPATAVASPDLAAPASAVGAVPMLSAPDSAPTQTTWTGHVFTDRSDLEPGAWQDPSGMVWFDTPDLLINQDEANAYCRARGLLLPSVKDFKRLRSYMGASINSHHGFTPQILPHLEDERSLWSSSFWPDGSNLAFYFQGLYGSFGCSPASDYAENDDHNDLDDSRSLFRCVRPRAIDHALATP